MAFTVRDFEEFLEILGQHPEWQSRLRRLLLDEEMSALRAEMAESHQRLEVAIAALATEVREFAARTDQRFEQMDKRFDWMDERFQATDGRLDRIESDVRTLKDDVHTLKDDVGSLKGALRRSGTGIA